MNGKNSHRLIGSFLIILFGVLCQFNQLIFLERASAQFNSANWSWSAGPPKVFSSIVVADVASALCPGYYKTKNVVGGSELSKVCMADGDNINFGIFYANSNFLPVVGLGYDAKLYRLNGICGQFDNCLYLSGSDTLVTKQYLINGIVRSLIIYKNFTNRLAQSISPLSSEIEYYFDSSNPDFVFMSEAGYAWPVSGIGASSNGKWLAIEFRQRGIGLLNIETMQMKRISTMAFSYGTGRDPVSELAVSNEGRQVAIMGANSGMTILDVSLECGDEATDERMSSVFPITERCSESPVVFSDFIDHFSIASHPKFNDDGGELSFFVSSYASELREVSLRATGYDGQRLDYLALGDSFSSGEGESDDSYYLPGTNVDNEKCHLSTRSYPYLLASLSSINLDNMKSVACSGATTADVVGEDTFYFGQGSRLGSNGLVLNDSDVVAMQTEAKASFLPGRVHQVSFVKKYQPKIISLGIGGNDAGFMDKLKACLAPGTCDWVSDPQKREQVADEIKDLFSTFVSTYEDLHNSSSNSNIYVVGYPKMVDSNGECDFVTELMLNKDERQFMNEAVIYINQVIAAAAKRVGVTYLDIQDSYGGQTLCGGIQPSAVNSVKLGDDISLIGQSDWFRFIGQESFHANPLGHFFAAQTIFESTGGLSEKNLCSTVDSTCPENVLAPEPSTYWAPDGPHDYPKLKSASFVISYNDAQYRLEKQIILPKLSLMPNSLVRIEICSTPQLLGEFVVASDGSLNIGVDLPGDLGEGYHTVFIKGSTYSGEPINLYQVIKYESMLYIPELPIIQPQPLEPGDSVFKDGLEKDSPEINKSDVTNAGNNVAIIGSVSQRLINTGELAIGQIKFDISAGDPVVLGYSAINSVTDSSAQASVQPGVSAKYLYILIFFVAISLISILIIYFYRLKL